MKKGLRVLGAAGMVLFLLITPAVGGTVDGVQFLLGGWDFFVDSSSDHFFLDEDFSYDPCSSPGRILVDDTSVSYLPS